jgi:BirA family biotin operon repressor/biotin-[acetyl-CoA-carboxylase] ligase
LAVCEALENRYHLQPQIKWPNDVLLVRRKTCGVLVEAHWQGDRLSAVILGIGINIAATSVPPDEQVRYPATCVENATGYPVDRLELLRSVLESVIAWRSLLDTARFISAWNQRLAFKGEWAELAGEPGPDGLTAGRIMGLDEDGGLILRDHAGRDHTVITGELRLRSTDA